MYLGLRIAGLKTQLQLNELARGTRGAELRPRKKVQKKDEAAQSNGE